MTSLFREVWVKSADGQCLYALINGEVGWLMYLRENGDAGFSSRNPEYVGPPDEMVEYRLDNGQHDLYPRAWAYPTDVVERALDHFRVNSTPPPFIVWHNDSGDGTTIGPADACRGQAASLRSAARPASHGISERASSTFTDLTRTKQGS